VRFMSVRLCPSSRTCPSIMGESHSALPCSTLAQALGRPVGGTVLFRANADGWIVGNSLAGSHALRALARVSRITDVFGPATAVAALLESLDPTAGETTLPVVGPYRLTVDFVFERGGQCRLVEERIEGLSRAYDWNVQCAAGVLGNPASGRSPDLFKTDTDVFVGRVHGTKEHYVSESQIIHVLQVVQQIEALLAAGPRGIPAT
jgi:hypothetical protein